MKYSKWLMFFVVQFVVLISGNAFGQIQSTDYHIHRAAFGKSTKQFEKNGKARVAFLGGSITYNPGWRDSTCAYLERKYPSTKFEFVAAGIPSMGSTPGAFRLERDILSKGKIDLLFVEAAVNDPTNGRTSTEQIRAMEGIVRHSREQNPEIDIIFMYFVDPDKMESYNNGMVPEVIKNHEKVAEYYGISSINLAKEVTDRINNNEFTWKDDFKNLHPSPFGQMVYYHSIKVFFDNQQEEDKSQTKTIGDLPPKLDSYCYDKGALISIEKAKLVKGWKVINNWVPEDGAATRKGYVNAPMLSADIPGAELQLNFKGKAVGIAIAAGPDAGIIEYSIDGSEFNQLDLFTKWSSQLHLPWYYVLEAELDQQEHELILKINHGKNSLSTGNACRIKHFFINE